MSGPKRDADSFNTIGIVVIGICGVVMVYVTIVALQAFYVSDTSEIQTMADYGGQDTTARSRRADELRNITEAAANSAAPGTPQTYRIRIDGDHGAMELVANDAKNTPDHLVPLLPPAVKTTVKPVFSRGQVIDQSPHSPGGSAARPGGAGIVDGGVPPGARTSTEVSGAAVPGGTGVRGPAAASPASPPPAPASPAAPSRSAASPASPPQATPPPSEGHAR